MLSASPAWKLSHWKIPAGERTYTSPSPGLGRSRFIHLSSHLMVSAWLTTMPGTGRRRAMASLDPQNECCLAGGPGAAPKVPCPEVALPLGKQSGLSWLKVWLLTLNFTAEEFLVLQVPKPKWLQKQKYIPEIALTSLNMIWFSLSTTLFWFTVWDKGGFNPRTVPNQNQTEKERLGMASQTLKCPSLLFYLLQSTQL